MTLIVFIMLSYFTFEYPFKCAPAEMVVSFLAPVNLYVEFEYTFIAKSGFVNFGK